MKTGHVSKYYEELPKAELILRRLLWLRHGCQFGALYRDDGEMQCGSCRIDFLRDTAEEIEARFEHLGVDKLRLAQRIMADIIKRGI